MGILVGKDSRPVNHSQYVLVAAGQTTQRISGAGNANERGDYLAAVSVVWATTSVGTVTLYDGSTAFMVVPAPVTGATDITPRYIELGIQAQSTTGFQITTGSSVTCLAIGRFG